MATAVRRLVELGGGIVAAEGDDVLAELPLPVAGLLSDAPLDGGGRAQPRACARRRARSAARLESPFQVLAFLALSVIPSLKLTDRGLVDVERFELVAAGGRLILSERLVVTMDDAGTEHGRGWLRIEGGLISQIGNARQALARRRAHSPTLGGERTTRHPPLSWPWGPAGRKSSFATKQ